MDNSKIICFHKNKITDVHEGNDVCVECGLVLTSCFIEEVNFTPNPEQLINENLKEQILEFLSRLNISEIYAFEIYQFYRSKNKQKKYISNKDYLSNIIFAIYSVLNKHNIYFSLKEMSNISGVDTKKIFLSQSFNDTINISLHDLLEKYVSILNLNFKAYSVIKENLPNTPKSGHNPYTIVASEIYKYCKNNNLKISMKFIAKGFSINPVSIQRYLKNNK